MTTRLERVFTNTKGYIGYLTAGDGGIEKSVAAYLALVKGGVNILEVGIPFSDPLADGPVIQRAMCRTLKRGVTPQTVLTIVQKVRTQTDVPIVLFSYVNPLLAMGPSFLQQAQKAGCDALLVVDLPLEESATLAPFLKETSLATIHVVSVDTPLKKVVEMEKRGKGFLYYACRKGTTGVKTTLPTNFANNVQQIRSKVALPVVAGFGISNRQMAQEVNSVADGFVVGSTFVGALEKGASASELEALARSINPR